MMVSWFYFEDGVGNFPSSVVDAKADMDYKEANCDGPVLSRPPHIQPSLNRCGAALALSTSGKGAVGMPV